MNEPTFSGQRVAVLGYAVEGQSSAEFLFQRGARVEVFDERVIEAASPARQRDEARGIPFHFGGSALALLPEFDWIFRTPSFSPHHPALQTLDRSRITTQAQIFLQRWAHRSVGVTGTKGKGTTASLLYHLLKTNNQTTLLGGNIGVPLLDIYDQMDEQTTAVLELSSYQLWDVTASPATAVLLMVVPEHLDVHQDEADYVAAKGKILAYQHPDDLVIASVDYPLTRQLALQAQARRWEISMAVVECGAEIHDRAIWIQLNHESVRLADIADTKLQGQHNLENIAAAALAAIHSGLAIDQIQAALPSYQPLPHRLELVAHNQGIDYIDDSIATNPDSARAALRSMEQPVVMILGGVHPTAVWDELVNDMVASEQLVGVVLIGAVAAQLSQQLHQAQFQQPIVHSIDSMSGAVQAATGILQAGRQAGTVLLSPGAKSFDMFKDYQDRGNQFRDAAKGLAG